MKKKVFPLLFSIIIILITIVSGGCSNSETVDSVEKIKNSGKLVLLTNAQYFPFEFIGYEGSYQGVDIDVANEIAKDLGVSLEVVDMEFEFLIDSIKSGKGDIAMAAFTATDERKEQILFSDPYMVSGQYAIFRNGEAIPDDLSTCVVGVQQSSMGDYYATDTLGAEVLRYNNVVDATQALLGEKCDCIIFDVYIAKNIVEQNPDQLYLYDKALSTEEYAIAMQKGRDSLCEEINTVIKRLKDENKIEEFFDKYKNMK